MPTSSITLRSVSEGLNSVETLNPYNPMHVIVKFQKDLIVWKLIIEAKNKEDAV